jgi:5-methylcytosine-specific restriction enzyme A
MARRGEAWQGMGQRGGDLSAAKEGRMRRRRRLSQELWQQRRREVWTRDGGQCQGPHCVGAPPIPLEAAHIDHIVPLSKGGGNSHGNLRTLCRRCHVLRAGREHRGMIAAALRGGIIPPDWRPLVWEG